jgi:pilus assembly protein FimV
MKAESEEITPAYVAASGGSSATSFSTAERDSGPAASAREMAEEVDPVEEAEIFMAYGRDAQAEELLKEAIAAHPRRQEIYLKLLELYAKRKDSNAFEQVARELQQQTGGQGAMWDRAVRLGYQVDPENPRYSAGRDSVPDIAGTSTEDRVILDVSLDETQATTATDIDLGDTAQFERTQIFTAGRAGGNGGTEPAAADLDLNIDLPAPGGATEPSASGSNTIDFDFDVSKVAPAGPADASASATDDPGLDFDIGSIGTGTATPEQASSASPIDLSGISLDLAGGTTSPSASSVGKDEKWYEVQTKFDLAKAYQEMGDKDGAREILKEVLNDGDAEQKAAAQAVLASLE